MEPRCAVPEALALRDLSLPAAKEAAAHGSVVILTLGGAHTAGAAAGDQSATYPARLEAALRAALPGLDVTVVNQALPGKIASDLPSLLPGWLTETRARLVIWGPGGGDLARRTDPTSFMEAVGAGIDAIRAAGADLILLEPPYFPSPDRLTRIEPYRIRVIRAAAAHQIALLPRQGLMHLWAGDGTLDLTVRDPEARKREARTLFACVAGSLAGPIAEALR